MVTPNMRSITFHQPRILAFGENCLAGLVPTLATARCRRILIITSPPTASLAAPMQKDLAEAGIDATMWQGVDREPTLQLFEQALTFAREVVADGIIGFGGGSALDVAKLVAALLDGRQAIREVFGIGQLTGRSAFLACVPTTAGTGSEVSPNAILLDETEELKKGVVSLWLVPDAAYVDPRLTLTVPPSLTAATGMDALTHCIEAYTNRNAHAMVDIHALDGIGLIGRSLAQACTRGDDIAARTDLALGSLYGGLCLGPVNTAGVHALAYPLGGRFHVAHGLANALLLPYVMDFNVTALPERYARVAIALGVSPEPDELATARAGVAAVQDLSRRCGTLVRLRDLGIPEKAIPQMAQAAMTVTRLLNNNPRPISLADAEEIYRRAY